MFNPPTAASTSQAAASSAPAFFIKAFSNNPVALSTGFNRLGKVLKALHLRRVYLWPRFHLSVSKVLSAAAPEVIELFQPLTPDMVAVQGAIVSAMDAALEVCLSSTTLRRDEIACPPGFPLSLFGCRGTTQEMRRCRDVDLMDVRVEASLTEHFDELVRRQLDPVWHKVPPATKQVPRLLVLATLPFADSLVPTNASQPNRWLLTSRCSARC